MKSNNNYRCIPKTLLSLILLCNTVFPGESFFEYKLSNNNFLSNTTTKQQKNYTYDYNRFRIDFNSGLGNGLEIKAIGDIESIVGQDYLNTIKVNYLKDQRLDIPINLYHLLYDEDNLLLRSYIYRLYARLYFLAGSYSFGLQRIPLGVGKIWTPTDIVNPANPLSAETNELTGAYGSLLAYATSDVSEVQWFQTLNINNHQKETGGKILINAFAYDIEISAINSNELATNGLSLAGELFNTGMGIHTEIAYFTEQQIYYQYQKYIIGIDYTFSNSLYLVVEGLVNSNGETSPKVLPTNILVDSWRARYYLGATISYPITPLTTIELSQINNLNDGSFFTSPRVMRSLSDNMDVSFGATLFVGEQHREFWDYGNLVYTNIEIYF